MITVVSTQKSPNPNISAPSVLDIKIDNTVHYCLELLQDVPDNELIVQPEKEPDESKQEGSEMEKSLPFHWIGSSGQSRLQSEFSFICNLGTV